MLLVDIKDQVALVTLNRPDAMNALSRALRAELHATLKRLDADPAVKVIVLTGAGERAFTAGLDLKELGSDPNGLRAANATEPSENPAWAVIACRKPVIGAINGVAITGGFEVALACDVLIASTKARFADTHARVGITPGWGLSQKLSRLIGPYRAKELSLSGNFLDARTAEAWGLVNRVVAPEELVPVALQLAADMASIDLDMLITYKAMIDDGYETTLRQGLELEQARSTAHNRHVTPEAVEARRAGIQARGGRSKDGGSKYPLRPASRSTSPLKVEELGSHCSPAGELPAKRGEGAQRRLDRPKILSLRKDLVFLRRDDLAALVHPGLQVDVGASG
ncbi:MAG: enoyl-CoA hydratase [Phenylobacterium sp.]|uniref:enoyl-CoA hydratase n=2 Tax=Phenylobacterium sp. TaxID=1871053 RepID=UPI0025E302DE|nr:enoyl-CoA hydratase [Phenylobacterium sp.]MCA4916962.1 enoyl-CoA hydratase [Phenylobacterium sp.]